MTRLLALILLALASAPALAQAPTPADLLARAESAYRRAVELTATDRTQARAAFAESAAAYAELIEAGVDNARIQRNLGNTLIASGDLGPAIAALKRAERLDPSDPRTADALAAARAQVRSTVEPGLRTRAESALLWWRGLIPRPALAWTGAGAWATLFLALALGAWKAATTRWLVAGTALLALVGLGSLGAEWALIRSGAEAVVVQDNITARLGPSEAVYEPAFTAPVREGVEGRILEERDGWSRVRLRSGQQAWLPNWSLERV